MFKLDNCDLCENRERMPDSLLCESCREAISRLMLVAEWEANRKADKARNKLQVDMFVAYIKAQARSKP